MKIENYRTQAIRNKVSHLVNLGSRSASGIKNKLKI